VNFPYALPQFCVDLHEIWHVTSLYPPDGHEGLAMDSYIIAVVYRTPWVSELRSSPRIRAPRAVHMPLQMNDELRWVIRN